MSRRKRRTSNTPAETGRDNPAAVSVLDADVDMLTMDISFTYEDFEVLSSSHDPAETGT